MSVSTGQLQIGTGLLPDQVLIGLTTKRTAPQCLQQALLLKRPAHSFRRGGMLHLSLSAYNEIQKVVAKDHFSRHLNELTFRRWDDFAGKLHTFRRCERPERKENATTDAVADMARILTFRRWDDFAGKLHTKVGRFRGKTAHLPKVRKAGAEGKRGYRRCGGHGENTHLPKVGRFCGKTAHLPKVGKAGRRRTAT